MDCMYCFAWYSNTWAALKVATCKPCTLLNVLQATLVRCSTCCKKRSVPVSLFCSFNVIHHQDRQKTPNKHDIRQFPFDIRVSFYRGLLWDWFLWFLSTPTSCPYALSNWPAVPLFQTESSLLSLFFCLSFHGFPHNIFVRTSKYVNINRPLVWQLQSFGRLLGPHANAFVPQTGFDCVGNVVVKNIYFPKMSTYFCPYPFDLFLECCHFTLVR